jgi:hypothetical protein
MPAQRDGDREHRPIFEFASTRLLLVVGLALLSTGAFGRDNMTPPKLQAPIGAWEVRHGTLGEEFVFAPSGQYTYRTYAAQSVRYPHYAG